MTLDLYGSLRLFLQNHLHTQSALLITETMQHAHELVHHRKSLQNIAFLLLDIVSGDGNGVS